MATKLDMERYDGYSKIIRTNTLELIGKIFDDVDKSIINATMYGEIDEDSAVRLHARMEALREHYMQ
jgi:hypothetical protein